MTGRFISCRPVDMGGDEMPAPTGLNPAAATWSMSDNSPAPVYGWTGIGPVVEDSSGIYTNGTVQQPITSVNILRSTDKGASWVFEVVDDTSDANQGVFLVNGRAVLFCNDYCFDRSAAGVWSALNTTKNYVTGSSTMSSYVQVASGGGRVVCLPTTGTVAWVSTDDCATWTAETLPATYPAMHSAWLLYDGTQFVTLLDAVTDYELATSADGATWQTQAFATPGAMLCFSYGAGLYVICSASDLWIGGSVAELAAATPKPFTVAGETLIQCAVLEDGRIVLLTDTGSLYTSADQGKTFVQDTADWTAVKGFSQGSAYLSALPSSAAMVRSLTTTGSTILNSAYRQELC